MTKASDDEVRATFAKLVNMSPREIEAWLETAQSKSVGQDSGDGESIGRKSGRRTLQILRIKRAPNAEDVKHMRRVVSFIRRHSAQSPLRGRETSRWRYSLMNWGHDPLKDRNEDSPWR